MSFSSAIINDNLVNAENQIPHASEDHISSELGNVDRDDQHPAETIQESHEALGNPRQTFEDGSGAAISTTTGQDQLLRPENQDPPSGEFSRPSSTLFQHQHPSLSALSTADEDISLSQRVHTVPGAGLPTHNEASFNFETSVHEHHLQSSGERHHHHTSLRHHRNDDLPHAAPANRQPRPNENIHGHSPIQFGSVPQSYDTSVRHDIHTSPSFSSVTNHSSANTDRVGLHLQGDNASYGQPHSVTQAVYDSRNSHETETTSLRYAGLQQQPVQYADRSDHSSANTDRVGLHLQGDNASYGQPHSVTQAVYDSRNSHETETTSLRYAGLQQQPVQYADSSDQARAYVSHAQAHPQDVAQAMQNSYASLESDDAARRYAVFQQNPAQHANRNATQTFPISENAWFHHQYQRDYPVSAQAYPTSPHDIQQAFIPTQAHPVQSHDIMRTESSPQQYLPEPLRLQLITGEWITIAALQHDSPVPAQCWPIDQSHASAAPTLSEQLKPPAQFPEQAPTLPEYVGTHAINQNHQSTPSSGIDPGDIPDDVSDSTEDDTHTLNSSQRDKVALYHRQLVRHHSEDDPVDFSRRNVVDTMCILWPISIVLPDVTKRTKVSTVHELLQHYLKHYSSYISNITTDLKRKEGPELQLAIRTTVNSMYLVRNEFNIEVIQLALMLYITDRIRDTRLSAKIQMIKHLSNEAMWTPSDELDDLWEDVLRLHESPMTKQLQAQSQGSDIWSSPGVTTFSPHHLQYTETWSNFFRSVLHILCYQPKEFIKRHFERAMVTFEDPSWKQLPGQHVREFNSFFKHKLSLLSQAAVLDGLVVDEVLPKRLAMVTSYKNRLLQSKREACLRSLKRKTYTHDHPELDLDYAGNTLENLTLLDFMILSSVAWREEDAPEHKDVSKPYERTPHERTRKPGNETPYGKRGSQPLQTRPVNKSTFEKRTTGQRPRSAAAAVTTDASSLPDIATLQSDTVGRINTGSTYMLVKDRYLSPVYKFGCTQCSNCKKPHWHDQPCDRSQNANSVMANSKRHSDATAPMIAKMNSSTFHRLTQRYQGGKDGQPPSERERTAIMDKDKTKGQKPHGNSTRESHAA